MSKPAADANRLAEEIKTIEQMTIALGQYESTHEIDLTIQAYCHAGFWLAKAVQGLRHPPKDVA